MEVEAEVQVNIEAVEDEELKMTQGSVTGKRYKCRIVIGKFKGMQDSRIKGGNKRVEGEEEGEAKDGNGRGSKRIKRKLNDIFCTIFCRFIARAFHECTR